MVLMWIMFGLLVVLGSIEVSSGLRLLTVEVPRHADLGTSVTLNCFFDLDDKNLYSVKWYKDDYEFFRYMPDQDSQKFNVSGINCDRSSSDMNHVKLYNLEYNSSGTYKCEVSTEGPAFETIFRSKNMSVLAYPDRGPVISGALDTYSVGDFITVNCSSGRSNPEPVLAWYINGIKADSYLLDHYVPKTTHVGSDPNSVLYSRSLGMRMRAEKSHFQGGRATINLKCTSTVGDMTPQIAAIEPRLASASSNQKLAQEMSHNKGTDNDVCFALLLSLLLCAVFFST